MPTIEEFVAIMDESKIDDLVFPTMGGDLTSLLAVVWGILETTANRWFIFGKLYLRLVFDYISDLGLPEDERPRLYYLRAFAYVPLQGIS